MSRRKKPPFRQNRSWVGHKWVPLFVHPDSNSGFPVITSYQCTRCGSRTNRKSPHGGKSCDHCIIENVMMS